MNLDVFVALCGVISTALAIFSVVPYMRSIFKGETKPHQFSMLIFAIMNGVVFLSQFLEGGRSSIFLWLAFFVNSIIVLIVSIFKGTRDTSRYDRLLFVLSLITIALWALTRSNELAIWLTLVIDICPTTMILLKIRADPHSEAWFPWALVATAFVFSLLSLVKTPFGILYVRPIYGFLSTAIIPVAIYVFLAKHRDAHKMPGAPEGPPPNA